MTEMLKHLDFLKIAKSLGIGTAIVLGLSQFETMNGNIRDMTADIHSMGRSVSQLNEKMATVVERTHWQKEQLGDHGRRILDLEKRVEGRQRLASPR